MMFEFEGTVYRYNEYGDRVNSKTPLTVFAKDRNEAKLKARAAVNAEYDEFRRFWSHKFVIERISEVQPND